jgi:L-aspartate oxidase
MDRFMPKYHDMAELAPRDVVARAIAHELEISGSKDAVAYLDLTHKSERYLRERFPRIYETCLQYNVDIGTDLIPVRPAAHYAMGGVRTDLDGRTNLRSLFAAGEVACTGVHGANRLASNSLLEGLVFGARAGRAMCESLSGTQPSTAGDDPGAAPANDGEDVKAAESVISAVQDVMWREVGIVRTGGGLRRALKELEQLCSRVPQPTCRRCCEAHNLYQTAQVIVRSALAREESRGAHYRTDYPVHNDARFLKHSVAAGDKVRFVSLA